MPVAARWDLKSHRAVPCPASPLSTSFFQEIDDLLRAEVEDGFPGILDQESLGPKRLIGIRCYGHGKTLKNIGLPMGVVST